MRRHRHDANSTRREPGTKPRSFPSIRSEGRLEAWDSTFGANRHNGDNDTLTLLSPFWAWRVSTRI
jgi:hypothetical protein